MRADPLLHADGTGDYFAERMSDSLRRRLRFEFRSLLGRALLERRPDFGRYRLLNLGCGGTPLDGFLNADFYVMPWQSRNHIAWTLDLRRPLRCPDDQFEGVFTEHTLEHLTPPQVRDLLYETFRVLRPGGRLRVVLPDLRKYVRYYVEGRPPAFANRFRTGCEAMRSLTQGWGHVSLWDPPFLTDVLERIGFADVRECEFGQGADTRLLVERADRRWESFYVEGCKPAP